MSCITSHTCSALVLTVISLRRDAICLSPTQISLSAITFMLGHWGLEFLAKIAVEQVPGIHGQLPDAERGRKCPHTSALAAGDGWTIYDVVCTAGPGDPVFEEKHSRTSVAVVVDGTFQYLT